MRFHTYFEWPLGQLLLVSDGDALTGLFFVDGRHVLRPDPAWREEPTASPFPEVRAQLQEYWEGRRLRFDLPLKAEGTAFQQRVWEGISEVPLGTTITYRMLAERVGGANKSRAVGLATGQNPISIVVPCHRIVGTNGSLTGYGGGLPRKRALLEFEALIADGGTGTLAAGGLFESATPAIPAHAANERARPH